MLVPHVQPGVTTEQLDQLVVAFAMDHEAIPAPLNYRGFPKSICTSVNHVVCHGIPGSKPLREGDIVNIDVTLIVDGWHGDTSRMFPIGEISRRAERLLDVTYECLMRGVQAAKPGNTTGDIGDAIQTFAEAERCSVVRDYCGHGLGRLFHDRPNILHYGTPGEGIKLEPGMLFTIEPMISTLGGPPSNRYPTAGPLLPVIVSYRHSLSTALVLQKTVARFSPILRPATTSHPTSEADCLPVAKTARQQQNNETMSKSKPLMADPGPDSEQDRPQQSKQSELFEAPAPGHLGHRTRLRQRFMQGGPDALPDYELLELVLFRAIPRRDTKDLAKRLIARFGSFAETINAPEPLLREVTGVGSRVVEELKLVRAAAVRLMHGEIVTKPVLASWPSVLDYCRASMGFDEREQFRILFLDKKNKLIADEVQQKGTVDHTPVYIREVVKRALEHSATALILVHNHPSGDPTPLPGRH